MSSIYVRPFNYNTRKSTSLSNTALQDAERYRPMKKLPSDKEVMLERGFYLGRKLGSGSYSTVRFAATKDNFNKVAIKIIDRRRAPADYQSRFLPRELMIIKSLINPSVIRTYNWFETDYKIYQILELAEGGDVLEYIRTKSKGPVGMELTQRWLHQIARAVGYLHRHGVCHRDIKCENLLLDADLNIKLSDFGFTRYAPCRMCDTFCGSAAYAAPEIINSQPYDPLYSDVWAVGVVAYILATGYMPFGDDVRNVAKINKAQQHELEFPPIETPIDEPLKSLIRAMLTVDPRKRLDIQLVLGHPWCREVDPPSTWPPMRHLKL